MPKKYTEDEAIAAFWLKVNVSDNQDACWEWKATQHRQGYGYMKWRRKNTLAHRISYELANGKPPDNLMVIHSCDNPPCVNPRHLSLGDHQANVDDRQSKGRNVSYFGERNGRSKVSDLQRQEIRKRYASGKETQAQIGLDYGLSQAQIGKIARS